MYVCVEVCVYICRDLHSNYVHMNLSMSVYMCNICKYVYNVYIVIMFLQTHVCVSVRVCILSPVSKSDTI